MNLFNNFKFNDFKFCGLKADKQSQFFLVAALSCYLVFGSLTVSETAQADSTLSQTAAKKSLIVLGDSLSSGYGIPDGVGWVNLLKQYLEHKHEDVQVINAGISGETTTGGLNRLPKLLEQHSPAVVVIELGGNDGLRGFPIQTIKKSLSDMITQVKASGALPVMLGIRIPPNYGPVYTDRFHQLFFDIAKQEDTPLLPFLLETVALDPSLMQGDGIHPNAEAQEKIFLHAKPIIEDAVEKILEEKSP